MNAKSDENGKRRESRTEERREIRYTSEEPSFGGEVDGIVEIAPRAELLIVSLHDLLRLR